MTCVTNTFILPFTVFFLIVFLLRWTLKYLIYITGPSLQEKEYPKGFILFKMGKS